MKRGWWWLLLAGLSLAQAEVLTDRTGVIVRPNEYSFSGSCATGQIGMNGGSGKTYRCVSGRWEREDLPACLATDTVGNTCSRRSVCLNRTDGAILVCNASNVWQTIVGGSSGGGGTGEYNYSQAFTNQTTVALAHNLGTPNVLVSCYDGSDVQVLPDSVTISAADPWDVVVTFATAQSGRCVVNGSGNGTTVPGGGGGTSGYTDLREDGAARVNDAEYIDFLAGIDVSTLGQVSLDYTEKPINLSSTEVTGNLAIARGGTGNTAFTSNTCIRYDGTRFVSAATDCGSGGGGSSCTDVDNDCLADVAEGLNCTSSPCVSLNTETSGVLGVPQGGTGLTLAYLDSVLMGATSSAWTPEAVPDCDASTQKLMYDATDTGPTANSWYCGTDYYDASGSPPQGPEGAIQFYEGGALGSNAALTWTEASSLLKSTNIESSMYRGQGAFTRFDINRDGTYDLTMERDAGNKPFLGFNVGVDGTAGHLFWGAGNIAVRINGNNYFWLDFDGDDSRDTDTSATSDFCIRGNGIDANCDLQVDFNPNPAQYDVMIGNASLSYSNVSIPDCDGTGSALNYSRGAPAGTFSCQTISAGSSGLANKLDLGLDGTNVQVAVTGTVVNYDPDSDGTLEARLNADGSFETFGAADESGGMSSDGKLLFTADANNNGTGEGIDADPDGDGTYEWAIAGTGTLTMATGAVIPGVCASVASATTITANDCNVVTLTGSTPITTINTCNAANLGRQLLVLCNSFTSTLASTGNLRLGATRTCSANDVLTLVCDGTNWLEVAWAAN